MCIRHRTCLFHFAAGHCMVEFVDTNVDAVLAPTHLVLIAFWCQNYPSLWFLSREVLSHCSSTDCIVESTVANFWTSLKDVISARFCFHNEDGDDWSRWVCYAVSSGKSSSIGTTARCGLWPVEQYPSIFFLTVTNSAHLLTWSTWRSPTFSFHPSLGLPLRLVPSSS